MGYGNPGIDTSNPIVEINLQAKENDNFYFETNPEEQYIGFYHRHEDGTLMIGRGVLGVDHELIPDEIIFRKISYQDIQDTRERVSDIFYKLWFESNTLSEEEILSMQTTIRDGIKQTGRNEDEPLVFYKKDRNTLENRKDIVGDTFEQMCQYIFSQEIIDLENYLELTLVELPPENENDVIQYKILFNHSGNVFDIDVAKKVGDTFIDILNLSQLTKPKFGNKIDVDKAREILDTNIFELLPNQTTRQDQVNDFFTEFDSLIGPTPTFQDVDGDGVGEDIQNKEQDEQSRISYENQSNAFITRLDEQAEGSSVNQGKTLESMRNRLNTYLGDVDNIIETLEDDRPEYQNISDGFLKIRKPNQAIIIRAPGDDLLEFQKNNSYLIDGFTITMWVRFVSKTSEGTLFNYKNPLQEDGEGFRLETRTSIDNNGEYKRILRLVVKDSNGTRLRDNHWGTSGYPRRTGQQSLPIPDYRPSYLWHRLYPEIPTDDLNEWFFICATYDPTILETPSFGGDIIITGTVNSINPISFYININEPYSISDISVGMIITINNNEYEIINVNFSEDVIRLNTGVTDVIFNPEHQGGFDYEFNFAIQYSVEGDSEFDYTNYLTNKQYWLNHVNPLNDNEIVANSGFGAKCKVEVISRSDLLRARGYKIGDLSVTPTDVDETDTVAPFEQGNPPSMNFSFLLLAVQDAVEIVEEEFQV